MLKQPCAHDVGGDLRKDAAFLLPFSGAVRLRILVRGTVTRPDTVVQTVTCASSQQLQSVNSKATITDMQHSSQLLLRHGQVARGLLKTYIELYSYPEKFEYLTSRRASVHTNDVNSCSMAVSYTHLTLPTKRIV